MGIPFDPIKAKRNLLKWSRCRAGRRGILWDLSWDSFEVPIVCPILRVPFAPKGIYAPTLDRIFSDMGYIAENVLVVSKRANTIRSDATPSEILLVAQFYQELFKGFPL